VTKFLLRFSLAAALPVGLLSLVARAEADIPVPKPIEVKAAIEVRIDENAKKTRLTIPRSLLPNLPPKLSQTDDGTRTLIAGLATATAVTLGGLVFFRRRTARTPVVIALFGAVMLVTGSVCADLLPFGRGNRPPPEARADKQVVRIGDAKIEIVEEGDSIVLILDDKTFDRLDQAGSFRDKK